MFSTGLTGAREQGLRARACVCVCVSQLFTEAHTLSRPSASFLSLKFVHQGEDSKAGVKLRNSKRHQWRISIA